MGEFLLIVNPRAAAGKAERERFRLESQLRQYGAKFHTRLTERAGHAGDLAREALQAGAAGVAVVGGDGTMSEALGGFFDEAGVPISPGAWIGPLPCGTGGDFRKSALPGVRDEDRVKRLMESSPRALDVGWLEYVSDDGGAAACPFLNIASFGLGGLVDRLVNEGPKWIGGRAAFMWGALRASIRYDAQPIRLHVDGELVLETRISNVAVANGQFFGGGMHIAPGARLDDGLFDVVALPEASYSAQARALPKLYRGTILSHPGVFHQRGATVLAEPVGDEPVLLDVDGEAPGRLPATFTIRSSAVRLR
jgi:diacylglycerol kinase (ATP)